MYTCTLHNRFYMELAPIQYRTHYLSPFRSFNFLIRTTHQPSAFAVILSHLASLRLPVLLNKTAPLRFLQSQRQQ